MVKEDGANREDDSGIKLQAEASAKLAEQARQLFNQPEVGLPDILNQLLGPRIGSFESSAAQVAGNDGTTTDSFAAVVHRGGGSGGHTISIDSVAAVIDAYDELTSKGLRRAYERSKQVKAYTKKPVTDGTVVEPTTVAMTLFIVFARCSTLALDQISADMSKLNDTMPAHCWPDLVAVEGKGIISYTTRMPGEKKFGDFFLPVADHAPQGSVPPLWIYKAIRGTERYTFNKVASLLCARLAIFPPGMAVGRYDTLLDEVTPHGITNDAYQFDLSGQMRLVPLQERVKQLLPSDIYSITAGKKVIGTVEFQKWQDGGMFTVQGQFPIELFLIFLQQHKPSLRPEDLQLIRGPAIQVSYVLPITEDDFVRTLAAVQSRTSGIEIEKDERKLLIQKLADEGTGSPFYGRLMLGVLQVRDMTIDAQACESFDKLFDAVFSALGGAVRDAAKALRTAWDDHRDKLASRAIIVEQDNGIQITENIDKQLKREIETFTTGAVRTLKSCMQALAKHLGADIGFLFQQEQAFKNGVQQLGTVDPLLADYLLATRPWSEALILFRNDEVEHGFGANFRVNYQIGGVVAAREPEIRGEPMTVFVERTLDRLMCFVEEVTVHQLQKKLPRGIAITEIPVSNRTPKSPERFRMTASVGGLAHWALAPHNRRFEEC